MKTIILGLGIVLGTNSIAAVNGNGTTPESGPQKMSSWISDHIQYPAEAKANSEEGTVYVAFEIAENGEMKSVQILQGVSQNLDSAAMHTVMNMPVHELISASEKYDSAYIVPIRFVIK